MAKGSHLGELEELVLLAVRRLGEEADGGNVRAVLSEQAGRKVSVSTIYVTLMRLEEKGYAHSWKGEPTGERGGKAKRQYDVTPAGLEELEQARAVRNRLWEGAGTRAAHG